MDWQLILVLLVVACAGVYVWRRLRRNVKGQAGSGCGCGGQECAGCPALEGDSCTEQGQCPSRPEPGRGP